MGLFKKAINNVLEPVEYFLYVANRGRKFYPPIFIIGAPRSSSTLFYQSVIYSFDVCYISNFMSNFYKVPITGWILQKLLFTVERSEDFKSYYGRTRGPLGPSEAADFWYQWFPKGMNVYVEKDQIGLRKVKSIRNRISLISRISGKPVVFKNLYNSMRIKPLYEAFNQAIFVVCKRNPVYIIQSILLSRISQTGGINKWWSVPPKGVEKIIKMDPIKQVAMQVYLIYRQIEEDLKSIGTERIYYVEYEYLCEKPFVVLNNFKKKLKAFGVNLKQKRNPPDKFQNSNRIRVDDDMFSRIVKEVNLLWKN
ncbi:MAG: sulfotransferase [Candidatus Marinimicrobia bacterium]|nr:sulfotransferase [Candidatus Neomarinimicrobiota bacterium]